MRLIARARSAARCLRCSGEISPGEPCFEHAIDHKDPARRRLLFHPECALDVDTRAVARVLDVTRDLSGSLVALRELAVDRVAAIERRICSSWTVRYESAQATPGYIVIEPSQPRDDDPRWVHPAHDNNGRPRVRVLCAGSAFSRARATGQKLDAILRAHAWTSPRREYVFAQRSHTFESSYFDLEQMDIDPAQPVIGAVYAAIATRNALIEEVRELAAMHDLGLPPPVLWLIGVSSSEPRDEHTMRFRELLYRCGYDGDSSPVLCAPKITGASLDRLVSTLDEHLDGREWRLSDAAWRLYARALADDVKEQCVERYTEEQLSRRIAELWSVADPETNALLIEAIVTLLDRGELDAAASILQRPAACDPALIDRWLRMNLADDEATLSARTSTVLSLLEREKPGAAIEVLFDAIFRSKNIDRTGALLGLLVWEADRPALARLEAWLAKGMDAPLEDLVSITIDSIRNRLEMEDSMRW